MPFRAILFDVGDTLWHAPEPPPASEFRRIAAERAAAFLREKRVVFDDPSLVARVAWNAMEDAMRHARNTDRIEPDYPAIAETALRSIGIRLPARQAAGLMEAIYVSGSEGGKTAYPDARATLLELQKRGFALGIVTNRAFGGKRFRSDLEELGLNVDWKTIVISVEVGFLKPHPAIFEEALRLMGTTPAETLMVGNSLAEDVAGAQALGMLAAWKRSEPDAEGVTADFEFEEVNEMLAWPQLSEASS